jgi:16S rRNA (guanine966-N2)-methyltransferase
MRIIAGQARGIQLLSPKDATVRPTTDRVKESVFGALEPIQGLVVVDLFSGSGALGLEAWSRGAAAVHLVESRRQNVRLIERNRDRVAQAMSEPGALQIIQGDVARAPTRLRNVTPDILLADPPYKPGPGDLSGQKLLQNSAFREWAGDALLVLEQATRTVLDLSGAGWEIVRDKRYGETTVYFLRTRAE